MAINNTEVWYRIMYNWRLLRLGGPAQKMLFPWPYFCLTNSRTVFGGNWTWNWNWNWDWTDEYRHTVKYRVSHGLLCSGYLSRFSYHIKPVPMLIGAIHTSRDCTSNLERHWWGFLETRREPGQMPWTLGKVLSMYVFSKSPPQADMYDVCQVWGKDGEIDIWRAQSVIFVTAFKGY